MKQLQIAGAAVAVAALALPAVASGHGSVFEITAKVAVPNTDPVQLADQTQYVVSNHGFSYVLRESNGQTATRGMLNFKVVPGAYRNQPGWETNPATRQRLRDEADTGAQPHATCLGAVALDAPEAILAWQGDDPFYNYVPFQATSAGLEDGPSDWLAVIEAETDVERADLATPASAATACASIGGTYRDADATVTSAASFSSGTIAAEKAPLEAQVAQLTQAKAAADAAKAAADRARATALAQLTAANTALAGSRSDAEKYLLAAAPVALDVFGSTKASTVAGRGASVSVTGPALRPATVQLQVTRKRAKAMGLSSRVLARKVTTIGAGGSTTVVIKPGKKVAKALRKLNGSLKVSVSAVSSSRDTASTTFTR